MTPKHPFQVPTTQVIDVDGEQIHQFPADAPGPLAIVLTVTNVTGGQRITFREQTTTSRTDATPIAAENPLEGEAMVPSELGTVTVGQLVLTHPLPGRDELVASPVGSSFTVETTSVAFAEETTPPTLVSEFSPSFQETRRVRGLYFLQFALSGTGAARVVSGLGAWPASYATAADAKAAGALRVLGYATWQTNDSGIWATAMPCLAITGNSFVDALYPINLGPVSLVYSGTVGVAFASAFIRIPAGFNL